MQTRVGREESWDQTWTRSKDVESVADSHAAEELAKGSAIEADAWLDSMLSYHDAHNPHRPTRIRAMLVLRP